MRAGELGTNWRPNEALSPDNRGANGLPFEALFAARDALFGPILVAQSGELCARWSRRPRLRDTIRRRSRPGAGPADWHLFTIDVEGAAFHEDPQEDVHHVKKWTPARGYEASTRSITT